MSRSLWFAPAAFGLLLTSSPARAESLIKHPGRHPDYTFEAEPHFMFGFDPPGDRAGRGYGPGFRGTVELVDNGFIRTINNTVGIGFGADCLCFASGKTAVWVPVVMQWNFWLTDSWSVFGEPGGGFYLGNSTDARPTLSAGGRYHFSNTLALTLRLGYPAITVGVSFVL